MKILVEYLKIMIVIWVASGIFPNTIKTDGIVTVFKVSFFCFLPIIAFGVLCGIIILVNKAYELYLYVLSSIAVWITTGFVLYACSKQLNSFEISGTLPLILLTFACILPQLNWCSLYRTKKKRRYHIKSLG